MMKFSTLCIFILLTIIFPACQINQPVADLIVTNGNIWTGNENSMYAQSMAIAGDSIIAIGTRYETQKLKGEQTEIIDLEGNFVTPGFIDSHVHLITGGRSLLSVDLKDANTPAEFTSRIAAYSKTLQAGEWILEGNWDHTLWGGELPKKQWIDESTKDHPVAIFRLDGHMLLANSVALDYAGIDKNTTDVEDGTIVRDQQGSPTGILKDNAMNLLLDNMPTMSSQQKENAFRAAMNYFLSNGVTSVHDVDGLSENYESYTTANRLMNLNELSLRIYAMKPLNDWEELSKMKRTRNKWVKIGGLKGFVDGSLGSHTAAFDEPYTDNTDDNGFFINTEADLYKWIHDADKSNLQVLVHAIGDRAIHSLLNIYENVIEVNGDKDRRFRIEHAQHISPTDIDRFAKLGVIASMQPYHAIDDGRWAEKYIGPERIKTTYAFHSLLNAKGIVVFGSDWAVAPASPLMGIYAAVTRKTLDGKNPRGWVPEQKITIEQALITYTRNAAFASFDENIKGSLEVGKLADFVVFSENILNVDPIKIKDIEVLQTYIGGKKAYDIAKKHDKN